MKNILTNLMTSAVLVAGIAGISPALKAANSPDAVSKLFADAQTEASQISLDWKSSARQPNFDWKSDAAEITRMREEANAAAKTIAELNDARGQATPAQLTAIDRLIPVLEEAAQNTTKAIEFLTKNQSRLNSKEYKEYIVGSTDTSNRLAGLISALVDYESHRDKFEAAKRMLLASK
jgi:hypothetical protein